MSNDIFNFIPQELIERLHKTEEHYSPYHQEGNVYNHSKMVLESFDDLTTGSVADRIAIFLHDVGKLYTRSLNTNGHVCYYNHENSTADLRECLLKHKETLGIDYTRIWEYVISVQGHMYKDIQAIEKLFYGFTKFDSAKFYMQLLLSDAVGRLSTKNFSEDVEKIYDKYTSFEYQDMFASKGAKVIDFSSLVDLIKELQTSNKHIIVFPIGISGCGKDYLFKSKFEELGFNRFGFDRIRARLAGVKEEDIDVISNEKYYEAHKKAESVDLVSLLRKEMSEFPPYIYISNLNLAKKSRRIIYSQFRQKEYVAIGINFLLPFDVVKQRQEKRKNEGLMWVDHHILRNMNNSITLGMPDEFDYIINLME